MSNVQLMDMGNLDIRLKNVRPSVGLTERGKKVARTKAQTAYNGQVYTEVNYFIKVNVDAFETKKNEIHIQNIKLSQENGEDILIQDYLAIIYPPQKIN
ncbi:hypothetical protein ACFQY3_24120 [Paenibacillus farraposensis]|uniref:hypothetical protein n=1 Tax=Paenibacillus farraposensis TaxID=2807095 RepID=UPI00361C2186